MQQLSDNQERISLQVHNTLEVVQRQPDGSDMSVVTQPANANFQFSDQRLLQHFETALAKSETIEGLLINISRIVQEQSDCLALWVCQRNAEGEFAAPQLLTDADGNALWEVVEDQAIELLNRISHTKQICASTIASRKATELIAAPTSYALGAHAPVDLMIVGCFSSEKQSPLRQQWLMGFATQTIARWIQHQTIAQQDTKNRSLNDAMGLIHALNQTKSVSEATLVVANQLRKLCKTDQVAICFGSAGEPITLQAVSDVETMDINSESNKVIRNACSQAIETNELICCPPLDGEHAPEQLALDKFCKANGVEACIAAPLKTDDGQAIGSILFAVSEPQLRNENFRTYINRMVSMVSGHLDIVIRANHGLRDVARRRLTSIRKAKRTKTLWIAILLLCGLMMTPLPYRVGCDCEIQPVMRRFISSPYDGILEKAHTKNGEIVSKDDVIAHLDGRQLRIELSGLNAELSGAKKRRDSALAQGDIATSQIARSEMRRHQSKIDIIEQQLTNLEVRSPIDGIVVSGDLGKVEGSPLEMGQTMFEIAPLDEMVAEIGIPESEIQYVKSGMKVAIKLNAFPFKTWKGTIKTIYPRTEIVADESVFIAQVSLENLEHQLRPGMKGSAKITSKWAPLGWNLFHQPWESVRYWLIW